MQVLRRGAERGYRQIRQASDHEPGSGQPNTGSNWIKTRIEAGIKISTDGRGRYLDTILIERLWRSLKQEAIHLHEITNGFDAKRIIQEWIRCYNTKRPHTALEKRTPDQAFFAGEKEKIAA